MSFKKIATSAAVLTGLVTASLGPLTTAASAHERRFNDYDRSLSRSYDGPRHFHGGRYHGPRYRYAKRHNHGKDIAKGLAIGLGVLAVGSIIAHSH